MICCPEAQNRRSSGSAGCSGSNQNTLSVSTQLNKVRKNNDSLLGKTFDFHSENLERFQVKEHTKPLNDLGFQKMTPKLIGSVLATLLANYWSSFHIEISSL